MRSTLKRTNLLERRRSSGIAHPITIADAQSLLELVVPLVLLELVVPVVAGVGVALAFVVEPESLFALELLRESVL